MPWMPALVASRTRCAEGSRRAAYWALPTDDTYVPANTAVAALRTRPPPDPAGRRLPANAAEAVDVTVAARAPPAVWASVPCTSPADSAVTPNVCTPSAPAAARAARSRPEAPMSTSSARHAAMPTGPRAVPFNVVS